MDVFNGGMGLKQAKLDDSFEQQWRSNIVSKTWVLYGLIKRGTRPRMAKVKVIWRRNCVGRVL